MKRWLISLFSLIAPLAWNQSAFSAACCGGGFAAPSIIMGDDKAQISTSYSYSQVAVDNVDAGGIWRKWDQHQQVQTLRIDGAHILSDRWQAGFTLPLVQRSRLNQNYSGLGDVAGSVAYEYLPDWDYNPYRPKGMGFFELILPTGKSKAESEVGGLDSTGNGFLAVGLGTVLSKAIHKFDVYTSIEVHRSFDKKIDNSQIQGTLRPGFGGNLGIGAGYNLQAWRLGTSVTWTYEDPINIAGPSNIDGSLERYATAALSVSYMAGDDWSGTLSYTDQTLFGSPVNTSLGRSIAFQLLRKWGR